MKILVTNDDGINAPGLWALVKELQSIGTIMVVAPDREQSGVGTSVTLHRPVRVHPVQPLVTGIKAYAVQGTPTDGVIIAVRWLIKDSIDLVISGINEGANLGNDVFISGTVGAALQGYFYGIPSVALSIAAFEDFYFDGATKLAKLLAVKVKAGVLPERLMLNINVPNLPLEKIEGLEITRLGERAYSDLVEHGHNGRREYYWIRRGEPQWYINQGTDIWALRQNRISITPLFNNPNGSLSSYLSTLAPNFFQELFSGV